MRNSTQTDQDQLQPFIDKVHVQADTIVKYFIGGYFIFGFILSPFYHSYLLALIMGSVSLGIYLFGHSIAKEKGWFRVVVSLLFWNFGLQFILQMQGMYAMHFFYFVSLTVLLFYEDWRLLLPAVTYAIGSFITIFYLQYHDSTLVMEWENLPELNYYDLFFHVSITVVYALLCMAWARMQHQQTIRSAGDQLTMQRQLQLMESNINFANSISKGDLTMDFDAEHNDKLGQSLMNMRNSLVEASNREDRERFINTGLAAIGEILRNHSDDLNILSDQVISKIVKYMKANQGGIFIIQKDPVAGERYLELKACRAFERKKFLQKRIEIGQGLVGQSAIEQRVIYMTEVPENYVNITSGLGDSNPKSLLIVPLISNEEIMGVIEVASFEVFDETDKEFLIQVGESIAATVISTQTNERTKELLEQSNQMTEEMQAQEEEMRQNMEEMQATQEEMGRTQRELAQKEANLDSLFNNTGDSIVTINKDYEIVMMNQVVKQRYKGTQYENIQEGSNALDMLGNAMEEWKGYYDRAFQGESLNFTLESSVLGEDTWREYFINPIKDTDGNVIGASIFSRDITGKMKIENEMHKYGFVVKSMINTTSDTYFAIDKNYSILVVNQALKSVFAESGVNVEVGMNILEVLPPDQYDTWKERYDRCFQGEKIELEEERIIGDRTLCYSLRCEPIMDDKNTILGVTVVSKDITKQKQALMQVEKLTTELQK